MTIPVKIEGRATPIINPNTNLSLILSASYQDRTYELFRVGVGVVPGGSTSLEDQVSLPLGDTKTNPDLVKAALHHDPPAALVLHFRSENGTQTSNGLNGVILVTELGKEKYFALGVSEYGSAGPVFYEPKDTISLTVEPSARKAINDIPKQL